MRLEKCIKNLIYSFGYYGITVLSTFILRKIMLQTIGLAGVSLNSLFHEVIAMMSLSEMGVGTAIIYNLYQPLNEQNEKKIKELMSFFRNIYFVIAAVMIGIGVIIIPFIQYFVNSTGYEISYIRYIFFLFVLQTAVSYCFAYKRSLLAADQKNYVIATWDSVFKIMMIIVSCVALWTTRRFDIYLISTIILSFINNMCISLKVDKIYPYLKYNRERLPKNEIKKVFDNVKNLFVSKVSGTVTNSTDNILISVLVNTLEVGKYANYALVINAFKQILIQITNAVQGSVGNLYAEKDFDHIDIVLRRMTFGYFCFATIFCCGYFCSATSFIGAIFGKQYIMANSVVFITSINLYFHAVREPIWQMMTVSGLFKQDRNIAVVGTIVNLIVSILIGRFFGILGIFIGTLCTYLIQVVLKIPVLYKYGLKKNWRSFFIFWFKMLMLSVISMLTSFIVTSYIKFENLLLQFFVEGFIAVLCAGAIISVSSMKTSEWKYFWNLLLKR